MAGVRLVVSCMEHRGYRILEPVAGGARFVGV
jgi:hypothetical protein